VAGGSFWKRLTAQRAGQIGRLDNVGAGMVIGSLAAAFFLDKPSGTRTKIAIAIAGLVLGWLCYSIASNMLTYLHVAPEDPRSRGGL
jgi:predicted acyltransferase